MKQLIETGSDFSGVGAFDYAMARLSQSKGFEHKRVFACDWDKFARQSYTANHGEPNYYPKDVYDRKIPKDPLDIYMTSPPCQAFSLAGNRLGKEDVRGILFFNSHEFIKVNQPRFFIFENVKGLLSDNKKNKKDDIGQTFKEWLTMLGGKSVNGIPTIFPYETAVNYHVYWTVINSKDFGVPQNRERVFIVGIRDDSDNNFSWPIKEPLKLMLKDILDDQVDEKYFLSKKMMDGIMRHAERHNERGNGFAFKPSDINKPARSITTKAGSRQTDKYVKVGTWRTHDDGRGVRLTSDNNCPTIPARAREDGSGQPVICIPVLTPNRAEKRQNGRRFKEDGDPSFNITTQDQHGIYDGSYIRRLTPLECHRLQDFPDIHVTRCIEAGVSDAQLYKQAGNSITVRPLFKIIERLPLLKPC